MKPFNIKLSDEHRAKLEAIRKAQGLRSEADAVRYLIDANGPQSAGSMTAIATTDLDPGDFVRLDSVQIGATKASFASPAAGNPPKTKSRLKGEWKAP